jgi:hypothetical protein
VDLLMRKPVIFPCAHEVKTVDTWNQISRLQNWIKWKPADGEGPLYSFNILHSQLLPIYCILYMSVCTLCTMCTKCMHIWLTLSVRMIQLNRWTDSDEIWYERYAIGGEVDATLAPLIYGHTMIYGRFSKNTQPWYSNSLYNVNSMVGAWNDNKLWLHQDLNDHLRKRLIRYHRANSYSVMLLWIYVREDIKNVWLVKLEMKGLSKATGLLFCLNNAISNFTNHLFLMSSLSNVNPQQETTMRLSSVHTGSNSTFYFMNAFSLKLTS